MASAWIDPGGGPQPSIEHNRASGASMHRERLVEMQSGEAIREVRTGDHADSRDAFLREIVEQPDHMTERRCGGGGKCSVRYRGGVQGAGTHPEEFEIRAKHVFQAGGDSNVISEGAKCAGFVLRNDGDARERRIANDVTGIFAGAFEESLQAPHDVILDNLQAGQHQVTQLVQAPACVRGHATYSTLVSGSPPQHCSQSASLCERPTGLEMP